MKDSDILMCTQCGSTDIQIWGEGGPLYCKDCENSNTRGLPPSKKVSIIEVKKKDLKKFQKEIKKKPLV